MAYLALELDFLFILWQSVTYTIKESSNGGLHCTAHTTSPTASSLYKSRNVSESCSVCMRPDYREW